MDRRKFLLATLLLPFLSGAAFARTLKPYTGPNVTNIVVFKKTRRMYLMHGSKALKSFRIGLGTHPVGHKQFEGDGRTPEGTYFVDRHNPNSAYYLSVGISYPNANDRAYAAKYGRNPGGDIFIHGRSRKDLWKKRNWSVGCITVSNRHIEQIFTMVHKGTQIDIFP